MISIIIPTYNREKTINRAINSVLAQTYTDFELLVVDDGSTDNTSSIINNINDRRLKYIKQKNGGANVARNNGIVHATGEYVAFLDSDDTFEPTMLEELIAVYEKDLDVNFIYTNLDCIDVNGNHIPFGIPFGIEGNCYKEALEQGYIAPTSVISARKKCFDKAGLFDITLPASQDDDMCFKMAKHYKIAYIPKILAHMHSDAESRISNIKNPAKGWWMLWNKYEKDVVTLCGKNVMMKHYRECLSWFVKAKMYKEVYSVKEKYEEFGGKVSYKTNILLLYFKVTRAKYNKLNTKLLNSL